MTLPVKGNSRYMDRRGNKVQRLRTGTGGDDIAGVTGWSKATVNSRMMGNHF